MHTISEFESLCSVQRDITSIVGVADKCLEALSKLCSNNITVLDVNRCIGIKAIDHQQRTKIPKKNRRKKNKSSKNKSSSTVTPGHFDFSALLNDPNIRKLAEQLQETLHEAPQDDLTNSRDPKYASTMLQIRKNLDLKTMVRRLICALMQDPSLSSMVEIYTDPSLEGQRKRRTAHLNKDPCLKLILDEIENGGPAAEGQSSILKMISLVNCNFIHL
ncbi:hypothetical protein MTR_1g054600 [Medicago truncatula]|uniref:Uncharacterized protein n=1 Tax=Medicago truncatula TaxID=3880 RepID=A0A072VJZ6_MEDTR|nr:hypothetical protein MTR_1g054600 [Medicago truncatula]